MNLRNTNQIRELKEVAIRTIILIGIFQAATGRDKQEVVNLFRSKNFYKYTSAQEKNFLKLPQEASRYVATQLSWRIEGAYILLWTLGHIDFKTLPKTQKNLETIEPLFKNDHFYKQIPTENVHLREKRVIFDLYETITELHGEIKQARKSEKKISHEYHPSLVYEWHYALEWVINPEVGWDKIRISLE
jgi:hypothetical protein